ncbi:MAG: sel1 repeat family protein [Planctomycetaceae bacterium]|jgi:TPR repeat protein|nr:sel1 repeat family protein [Planctomycetaceae bacterium]
MSIFNKVKDFFEKNPLNPAKKYESVNSLKNELQKRLMTLRTGNFTTMLQEIMIPQQNQTPEQQKAVLIVNSTYKHWASDYKIPAQQDITQDITPQPETTVQQEISYPQKEIDEFIRIADAALAAFEDNTFDEPLVALCLVAAWFLDGLRTETHEFLYALPNTFRRIIGIPLIPSDPLFGFALFRYAAEERSFPPAYYTLGQCYYKGLGTTQNLPKAVEWFELFLQHDNGKPNSRIYAVLGQYYLEHANTPPEKEKAVAYLLQAAELGHPDFFRFYSIAANEGNALAQYILGCINEDGGIVPSDIETAIRLFHQSAEQGYADAQCRLGIIYLTGAHGIEADSQVALQWLRLAFEQGDEPAAYWLGVCYADGEGVQKNTAEALRYLLPSAQGTSGKIGSKESQYLIAQILLNEKNTQEYNPAEAVKWLRQSAQQAYTSAQTRLGICLLEGIGVKPDPQEARQVLRKAAKNNDAVAAYRLGEIYIEGNGVPANRKEAYKWYKQASDLGYVPAQQIVADALINGKSTKKNETEGYQLLVSLALWGDEEALLLLRAAAGTGNAAAQFAMSLYYEHKDSPEEVRVWLDKAVANEFPAAQCRLGLFFRNNGDDDNAASLFAAAAIQGDVDAMILLSLLLEEWGIKEKVRGQERERCDKEAFEWMKQAAAAGSIRANYFLGNFYRDATGTEANRSAATQHFRIAAECGDDDALDRVGTAYLYGCDVPADEAAAFRYYEAAAHQGNLKGMNHLGICYLLGISCVQNSELGWCWIFYALRNAGPMQKVLLRHLAEFNIDIEKLIREHERDLARRPAAEKFGDTLNDVFQNSTPKILRAEPPSPKLL